MTTGLEWRALDRAQPQQMNGSKGTHANHNRTDTLHDVPIDLPIDSTVETPDNVLVPVQVSMGVDAT